MDTILYTETYKLPNECKLQKYLKENLRSKTNYNSVIISDETLANIKKVMYLNDISPTNVTPIHIREIVKRIDKFKYCDNIIYIWKLITNKDIIHITEDQLKIICELYLRFRKQWFILYPKKKFMPFQFVIPKICYIIGYEHIADDYKPITNIDIIKSYDKQWDELCTYVAPNYSKLF